ncbi:MAG: cyclic di-GMP phosphodiesterase [Solirubrobacteraceae bacterium]|nr:cyclic di-GMP phosphodiesterase [Solirubrobacteraceae bacterium]
MERILIVDDDDLVRRLLTTQLTAAGHDCITADGADAARSRLARSRCSLVLCDLNMPGESGLELLAGVLAADPDLAAIVVSGVDDPQTADAAAQLGVSAYMVKPFSERQLLINVANALRERALRIENRAYREDLEELVEERTAALDDALRHLGRTTEELDASRGETIRRLSIAGEYRDEDTGDHVERVAWLTDVLARGLGLSSADCDLLHTASPLHDIGKVGIPDAILRKAGALDPHERAIMETHAEIGHRILHGSDSPVLDLAATIAWTHHERYDGTGYPRGLAGAAIPIGGRIVAVADVFDALTHDRVYRRRFSHERSVEIIETGRGSHFDPDIVDVFLRSVDELGEIARGGAPSARTRVLIAEHDDELRERIETALRGAGCEIVGTVVTVAQAFPLIHTRRPDVAVIDLDGPAANSLELTRLLTQEPGGPRILVYTEEVDAGRLPGVLDLVAGVASKRGPTSELATAVRELAATGRFVDDRLRRPMPERALSAREREILTLLARGFTAEQVAAELFLSPETIRTHLRNSMAKLSTHSRLHAVTEALRRGEISL